MVAGDGTKPVDIYARVSRLKRGEKRELSTEGQVAVCRARLVELGLPEGKVLVDPGRSAWNPDVKRPAWDELMDRLESGISRGAIMFDLERFTRQPKDGERMIDLAAAGLLVLDSESEYDLTTPNGKKSFRDAINAAAYYSDRLSTRVKRGLKLRAMEGAPQGHQRRYGFEDDHVTVREEEAEVIREGTRRLLAGETRAAVVSDFNDRGIGTRYGKRWEVSGLTRILTRDINCGRITFTDPGTGVETVVGRMKGQPIVSEEDFDRVCAVIASRPPSLPDWPGYICSSAAVCGRCRHALHGRPEFRRKPYPDGSVRRSYSCPPSGGCGKTAIDQRGLDEVAGALVVEILSDPSNVVAIEAAAREFASEAARLDLAVAEAEDVAEALAERLGRGELPLTRYNVAVRPLEERIKKLKAARAVLTGFCGPVSQQPLEASRVQWKRRWDDADHQDKRDLLTMALQGKRLVVAPAEHGLGSYDLGDIARRVSVG